MEKILAPPGSGARPSIPGMIDGGDTQRLHLRRSRAEPNVAQFGDLKSHQMVYWAQ